MTDKIEAAAREQLEELAREVACEKVGQCFSQGTDVMLIARAVKAAKYAYLACHASSDAEIAALRARLEAAEARAAKWVSRSDGATLLVGHGWLTAQTDHLRELYLMVPPVPLPETEP